MRIQSRNYKKRLNQYESRVERDKQMEKILHGEGLYVYRNRTKGDLTLPKPTTSGRKVVGPGQEWQGDNYYMSLVPQEAILVRTIVSPQQEREQKMKEEKLLLDQPEKVTVEGTVEQVVKNPVKKLNETPVVDPSQEVLLTEDPMDGVQILRG